VNTAQPSRRTALKGGLGLGLAAAVPILGAQSAFAVQAADAVNDYPYPNASPANADPWNFYYRNCTSFSAWRLNSRNGINFHNYWRNVHWGNASNWPSAARSIGLTVNRTAAVGAVGVPDGHNHVFWVNRLKADGTMSIEEYNWATSYGYGHRIIARSGVTFIHFPG
jgi:surface antigen